MKPRPNPVQRVRYLLGRPLPEGMRDWVIRDVTGRGNLARYLLRGQAMFTPVYALFLLLPGALAIRLQMVLLVVAPVLLMQCALRGVYRRHLLLSNGIDDSVIEVARLTHEVRVHDTWDRRLHRARRHPGR